MKALEEGVLPDRGGAGRPDAGSFREILKSTALIGGSTVLNVGIGICRTKAMALMLGPAGMGLMAIYSLTADLSRSVAQLGINSSGVRQIAEAAGTGDPVRIGRTATVLRRISVLLGVIGALGLAALSQPVSRIAFGNTDHAPAIALLSLCVLFGIIADGQMALVQGLRRIADLARVGTIGALMGALAAVGIVYVLGNEGIVPALIAGAALQAAISWIYGRRVRIPRPSMGVSDVIEESRSLLKLGVAFMASGFLVLGSSYLIRLIVLRGAGLEAAGFYQAAWSLGGFYVGFVLQAMGADFYPRLVGVASDDRRCNRMVNDQTQVSLLLAGPGAIATLTFADFVVAALYSTEFAPAGNVLRWICLGMALRIVSWPMGFIILAKGRQIIFFGTELAWAVVSVGLGWWCIGRFGTDGAGIAFFGSYVFHVLMIYPAVRRLSAFRWSDTNFRLIGSFACALTIVFCAFHSMPRAWAIAVGTTITVASGLFSTRALLSLVSSDALPRPVIRALRILRLA